MNLRLDVLIMIFSYFSLSEFKQIDFTCYLFFNLTKSTYHVSYEFQVLHRKCDVQQKSKWKFLALKKNLFLKKMKLNENMIFSFETIIEKILKNIYFCDDNYIFNFSEISIFHLHEVIEKKNTIWRTIFLIILVAQNRHNEINDVYQKLLKIEFINYDWIFSMKTRFELSISIDISMIMLQKIKEKTFFWDNNEK